MKNITFLLLPIIALRCNNVRPTNTSTFTESLQTVWTATHDEALKDIRIYMNEMAPPTRSLNEVIPQEAAGVRFFQNMDSFSMSAMSIRVIDEDKFLEDTSLDIVECLKVPEDHLFFYCNDTQGDLFMLASNYGNSWIPEKCILNVSDKISWLIEELNRSDSDEYQFLHFYAASYFILQQGGVPVIYDFGGARCDPAELAAYCRENIMEIRKSGRIPRYLWRVYRNSAPSKIATTLDL